LWALALACYLGGVVLAARRAGGRSLSGRGYRRPRRAR
jgi:hypothetical protein